MLRTFVLISKRIWTNLKFLQLVAVLLAMSLITTTHYKVISIILTLISIGLVAYIIIDNFITLKHSYEELKLTCTIKHENPATIPPSDQNPVKNRSKHIPNLYVLNKASTAIIFPKYFIVPYLNSITR